MTPENLFSIFNSLALAGWLLLAIAPNSRLTAALIRNKAIIILFAFVYSALVTAFFNTGDGGFGSLHDVQVLFQNPYMLLAGWLHYLAFDLFVGTWVVDDTQQRNIAHFALLPVLFLIFMFGPIGLLAYLGMREIFSRFRQWQNT